MPCDHEVALPISRIPINHPLIRLSELLNPSTKETPLTCSFINVTKNNDLLVRKMVISVELRSKLFAKIMSVSQKQNETPLHIQTNFQTFLTLV